MSNKKSQYKRQAAKLLETVEQIKLWIDQEETQKYIEENEHEDQVVTNLFNALSQANIAFEVVESCYLEEL